MQQTAWEYRWRWPADCPHGGGWGEAETACGETAIFPLEHPEKEIQAQWREPGGPWQAAVPHEFGLATCAFILRVLKPRDFGRVDGLRVCAAVRGNPAAFVLPVPRRVVGAEGLETLRLTGTSCCYGVGQVLRQVDEFSYGDDHLQVMNVGRSQAALLPVPVAKPGALPFIGAFMVRTGRLSEAETQLLKQEVASHGC